MGVTYAKNNLYTAIFLIASLLAFTLVLIRAKTTPFTHDETATFFFIVQNGHYMPYYAHLDTNNHILNSALAHLSYSIFGSSKFALRLPNLIFFLLLLVGLYRIFKNIQKPIAKIVLLALFIFSYNWFTFFSVCRGYGISFASAVMAFSFIPSYIKYGNYRYLIYICFWMQVAMAASLIMMPVFCLILFLLIIHQLFNGKFLKPVNLINLICNLLLIAYWVKFSIYLKQHEGLTHGAGESYWHVTFKTLIYMVTGSWAAWVQIIFVSISVILVLAAIVYFFKSENAINRLFSQTYVFYLFLFVAEFVGIYLMKKILKINYPEDRTALFFYITLALMFVYLLDFSQSIFLNSLAIVICSFFVLQFFIKLNFRKHELYIYDTFPTRFYEKLLTEQQSQNMPITIGGHRCREFIYGFMNYRSDGALNAMDAPELLHMNCDYAIAKAGEKPYYEKYYEEIDREEDWSFRLLRRKQKIENKLLFEVNNKSIKGNMEFFEFYNDTTNSIFPCKNPIRVDFTFKVHKVPVPWQAWLVVQIDSLSGNKHCFKRTALNWIKLNYNNDKLYTYSVVTPPLPQKFARFKAFIWNIKQEEMDVEFESVRFYQLNAPGINYYAPVYF